MHFYKCTTSDSIAQDKLSQIFDLIQSDNGPCSAIGRAPDS